ncbi:MAG: CehA/McbA family metallohydrolase [Myxococcota bacterium]
MEPTRPANPEAGSVDRPILEAAPWFTPPADWEAQHPTLSPNAQLETHFLLLAEQAAPRHPGDGDGRAWLERVEPVGPAALQSTRAWRRGADAPPKPTLPAASFHRFAFVFEAGPHGVAEGGFLHPTAEPFWDWSPVQTRAPEAPGYTTAEVIRGEAALVSDARGLGFVVEGAPLRPGDRVRFVYGAGTPGARVDRYAERDARILVAVDADGDGVRGFIDDDPRLDVGPRPARLLVAFGPAELAPGDSLRLRIALLDGQGNRSDRIDAATPPGRGLPAPLSFEIDVLPGSTIDVGAPRTIQVEAWRDGSAVVDFGPIPTEGVLRLGVRGRGRLDGFAARVNPIVVRRAAQRLVWGDLHGHTQRSDGTGRPDDYLRYAREVAGLDVVALTDHDHFGTHPLALDPEATRAVFEATDAADEVDHFVTLPGYEWTSWIHGHRHVLYFDPPGAEPRPEIFSAIDLASDRPDELWAALRGRNALTFAHHSAGDPVAVDWRFQPDPELEPVTEIASVHGQSESREMPRAVAGGIPGWFVLDTLRAGYRFGFVGSGDSHDGHPGLAEVAGGHGGLAGLFVERLDRAGVKDTLRRRRTFATNGIRPFFSVTLDDVFMGGTFEATGKEHRLRVRYEATDPIEAIELVRSGRVARLEPAEPLRVDLERTIPALQPGEFHYVRIRQENGGNAWSSPIYVDAAR